MSVPTKTISLEEISSLLRYDPETGIFYWIVNRRGGMKAGDVAGSLQNNGGIAILVNGTSYLAHRLAFVFMLGAMPSNPVDHIDGDRTNNKWANLRAANQSQNLQNRVKNKNSKSSHIGVSRYSDSCRAKKPWRAKIVIDGRPIHLGSFETEQEAADAYKAAKRKYHQFNPEVRLAA